MNPPRKRFGQHFLQDQGVVRRIVEAIAPLPGDLIVEIGPGKGVLTDAILARDVSLNAIEIDRDLCRHLGDRFGAGQLVLHNADALKFDLASLGTSLRVVGNLPYNISTPLLFRVVEQIGHVRDCHFMLQKEVVDRMAATPSNGEYGRLSVMIQYRFQVEHLFDVPPEAFHPPPKVDSAVVRLVPWERPPVQVRDLALFEALVRDAFSQRRKMIRNAMTNYLAESEWRLLGIDPTLRPENLSVLDFARAADAVILRRGDTVMPSSDAG